MGLLGGGLAAPLAVTVYLVRQSYDQDGEVEAACASADLADQIAARWNTGRPEIDHYWVQEWSVLTEDPLSDPS